jgi:hypothetical protein
MACGLSKGVSDTWYCGSKYCIQDVVDEVRHYIYSHHEVDLTTTALKEALSSQNESDDTNSDSGNRRTLWLDRANFSTCIGDDFRGWLLLMHRFDGPSRDCCGETFIH